MLLRHQSQRSARRAHLRHRVTAIRGTASGSEGGSCDPRLRLRVGKGAACDAHAHIAFPSAMRIVRSHTDIVVDVVTGDLHYDLSRRCAPGQQAIILVVPAVCSGWRCHLHGMIHIINGDLCRVQWNLTTHHGSRWTRE